MPTTSDLPPQRPGASKTALILTVVCAALGLGMALLLLNSRGQGGGAVWLLFPMLGVIAAHALMGPAAVVLAVLSRRSWVIVVVLAYFVVGTWSIWTIMTGRSPVEVVRSNVNEHWSALVEARKFPHETKLCETLAHRLGKGGRQLHDLPPLELPDATPLDANFLCRHLHPRLPTHLRRDYYRSTLLQLAALAHEVELMRALLDAGAVVEQPSAPDPSPLVLVFSEGRALTSVRALAQQPYVAKIRLASEVLLAAGADVNRGDSNRASVLHWAAGFGEPTLTATLLNAGADVNALANSANPTVAHYAILAAHQLGPRLSSYKILTQAEHDTWMAGQKAILAQLISAGAVHEPIVDAAVSFDSIWAVELLRDGGADITSLLTRAGPRYLTSAMHNNRRELFDYLVANGVDVNQATDGGDSLIGEFLAPQFKWQLSALIDAGADVDAKNRHGETPLEVAAAIQNVAAVAQLLHAGATVTSKLLKDARPEIAALLRKYE